MSVSCRDIAALECPQILLGPFEGFVLETSCTTVNCTIRDKRVFISTMLRAEKIIWAKQPRRGLPGIFFSHLKKLPTPVVTFASYKEDG